MINLLAVRAVVGPRWLNSECRGSAGQCPEHAREDHPVERIEAIPVGQSEQPQGVEDRRLPNRGIVA